VEIEKRFLEVLELTDRLEGGDSNDAQDKGGFTRKGAIQSDCDAWADKNGIPRFSIKDLDEARRRAIFKQLYFDEARCGNFGAPLDFIIYQYAVNFIPQTAIKRLQMALGLGLVDGSAGPLTVEAAAARGWAPCSLLLLARQAAHYQSIVERSNAKLAAWIKLKAANPDLNEDRPKDQRSFGPGWLNRLTRAAKMVELKYQEPITIRTWLEAQHRDYVAKKNPVC
jgi:hypothetical protein